MLFCILSTCVLAHCSSPAEPATEAELPEETVMLEVDEVTGVAIHPVVHGSVALTAGDLTILIDPYDGAERYTGFGAPDYVLITHTHSDHLDMKTLSGLDLSQATLVAPQAVVNEIMEDPFATTHVLANGESWSDDVLAVRAVAAYNPPPKENFHPKGKFNGYVLTLNDEDYYFSGDTEGVPEMRALTGIDFAFVCMNLPYTMDIEQAASAVLDFAPEVVYPYHYRNQDGTKSDVEAFRRMVTEENDDIEVRLENWYAES
jgi:L-ascorbate metabolism protein UlaG (beta-lactamase superfamily)